MLKSKNKKIFSFLQAVIIFSSLLIFVFSSAQAQTQDKKTKWTIPSPEIKISDKIHFSEPQVCGVKDGNPVYCIPWLGEYINEFYNWGIGAVGVVAALGMIVGGLIWLTAGGNISKVGEAKAWIGSSLLGLVLALGAYSILYQINPNLTIFKPLRIVVPQGKDLPKMSKRSRYYNCQWEPSCSGNKILADKDSQDLCGENKNDGMIPDVCCCEVGAEIGCSWQNTACKSFQETVVGNEAKERCGTTKLKPDLQICCCGINQTNTCKLYPVNSDGVINFSTNDKTTPPSKCNNYNFNGYGVDARILKAIAATESGCNPQADSGKACGLMQIKPETAASLLHWTNYQSQQICQELKEKPELSIQVAAQYIKNNSSYHQNDPIKIFAGYNGGYSSKSSNGTTPPLAASHDCPGALAFECCINPGGLAETQQYVFRAIKYYNGQ